VKRSDPWSRRSRSASSCPGTEFSVLLWIFSDAHMRKIRTRAASRSLAASASAALGHGGAIRAEVQLDAAGVGPAQRVLPGAVRPVVAH